MLPVLVPEEGRIRETWPYDTLVSFTDLGGIPTFDVADGDETRQQPPLTILHGEIALMLLQGGDQHLAWQGEETLLEPTRDRYRPLHERRDFVQQRIADQSTAS